ncbi:MAG: DNA adenine methylase [Desulfobacteraceae bacterium]|nr:DNA adenine methylase [Desulfobacteraceae bacterium]
MTPCKIRRPALRYHGGKWRLAPWIISQFPEHRCYVEPYGGAASVLLKKPKSFFEVYNDLDQDLVNLFEVVRNTDTRKHLIDALEKTPFARKEFETACLQTDDPIEKARRTVIRSYMGFSSAATNKNHNTGFRSKPLRKTNTAVNDWQNYPELLQTIGKRLQGVVLECREAEKLFSHYDSHDTLFYIDPPYLKKTRNMMQDCYTYEMTEFDHVGMLNKIRNLKGYVILSGYNNDLYDQHLTGWKKLCKHSRSHSGSERTEVLWIKQPGSKERMRQGAFETHKMRSEKQIRSITDAIDELRASGQRVSKSKVASIVGLSREQISRRYSFLFETKP